MAIRWPPHFGSKSPDEVQGLKGGSLPHVEADRFARGCPKSESGQLGQMLPGCLVEWGSQRHDTHVPHWMPVTSRSVIGRGRYCVPTHPGDPRSRHTGGVELTTSCSASRAESASHVPVEGGLDKRHAPGGMRH